MLQVEAIIERNLEDYVDLMGEDISQDLSRQFFGAYGVADDKENAVGVIVYELFDSENEDEDTKSKIRLLKADGDEALDMLHDIYREEGVIGDAIQESSYWLEDEKIALSCERAGFSKEQKENETVLVTLKEALEIPYVAKAKRIPDYIRSLNDIPKELFHQAIRDCLFSGKKGSLEDLGYLQKEWFENTISACTITDGKVSGLFLLRATPSGIIEPVLLTASGPDSRQHLAYMIAYSIKKGQEKYPLTTSIRIDRTRKEIAALVDKLFPGTKGNAAFFGNRREE